jgi:hypothetical protein
MSLRVAAVARCAPRTARTAQLSIYGPEESDEQPSDRAETEDEIAQLASDRALLTMIQFH